VSWPQGGEREQSRRLAVVGAGRNPRQRLIKTHAGISRLNSERARGKAVVGAGRKARPAGGCQTHQWGHIL